MNGPTVPILPTEPGLDPHRIYAEMREKNLVLLTQEPNGLHRWLVLGYAEGREALADDRLSKDPGLAWEQLRDAGYVTGKPGQRADYLYHLANTDPPDHTRLRQLISEAFTARRVEQMRSRVWQIADRLLDQMEPLRTVDLVECYSHPLATTVMSEILGVPEIDRGSFRAWATAMLTAPGAAADGVMTKAEGYAAMRAFFTELIEQKRTQLGGGTCPDGQPDVLTALIAARDGANALNEIELISTAMLLMSAGQEPTVNLINNGVLALLTHPDQLALLQREPQLIADAIEEFLRYDPPVELSTIRVATRDLEVADTVIPAGSVVAVSLASTGRDERHFTSADRLDITRSDSSHLSFGHGIHYCLGAPLARMQGQVGIAALIRRFPGVRLGCRPENLRWRPTRIMRGPVELQVHLSSFTR